MAARTSARARVEAKLEEEYGRVLVPDGKRRVVELRRDSDEHGEQVWYVDVGESEDDEHARLLGEAMGDDNGGGWQFEAIRDCFPHEGE